MAATVNRADFFEKLRSLCDAKRQDNCFYFTKEKYSELLSQVISAKNKSSKPLDYRRLKRFDILKVGGEVKLIVPLKPGERNIQYYVTNDEIFDILSETHTRIGHGGRTRMVKELQVKYKNITYEVVTLYLKLCQQCQMKHSGTSRKGVAVTPGISSQLNSRCHVDMIDMQCYEDGDFKLLMVYQDCLTKFVQLRPLKTKTVEEVARHLLEIFVTLGAPAILQCHPDDDREFSHRLVSALHATWKDVKVVHGKALRDRSQDSTCIQNMLTEWMRDNDSSKWSEGSRFVQFAKNTTYHDEIRQTPYEAMFGVQPKRGIASFLPRERIDSIESEEQLEEIVNAIERKFNGDEDTSYETASAKRAAVEEGAALQAAKVMKCETGDESAVCKEEVLSNDEISLQEITSTRSEERGSSRSCNCQKKCTTGKCSCRSNEVLCDSKCHGGSGCTNK